MFGLFKKSEGAMWLFVGLGNPGDEHARNRHNIGFMVADAIAARYDFPPFRSKFKGRYAEGVIAGEKVAILMPQAFMNNSGESVAPAAKFFKIPPGRVVVFYDELDLPPGKLRVKSGGGSGGHNGIKSIEAHLGTADFMRVRLGIGHPGDKARVTGYVLGDFAKADQKWLDIFIESIAKHCGLLAEEKESEFMTRVTEDTRDGI